MNWTKWNKLLLTALVGFLSGISVPAAGPARDWVTYPLIAGQVYYAGTVSVWHDDDTLYVRFQTTGKWLLRATYVAVAGTLSGIPQNKNGNPQNGNFPYVDSQLPPVTRTKTYAISLNVLNLDHMVIATHASVAMGGENEIDYLQLLNGQTAWAGDKFFPGGNWARYFTYDIVPEWWPEE